MRITVVGSGYVGLVAGTCFAETGNEVLCLDVDAAKVQSLSQGKLTLYEPGLLDLFQRNLREKRLAFTTDYDQAVRHARTYFLCLPTPPAEDGSADVSCVLRAVREIACRLPAGNGAGEAESPLFVLKSTVPVGTHQLVRSAVGQIYTRPFAVANNPEFLKEGAAVEDFMRPDRVVLGTSDPESFQRLRMLYDPFCRTGSPIVQMDHASAELTKYAANCFLATKISFMNEIARLCEASGADVELVRKGISLDARIGRAFLFPGLGYGGSCFPKDTRALAATARTKGMKLTIIEAADHVNEMQKTVLLPKLLAHLGTPRGKTVALWGLAFKPRTDDIREAPALVLIARLLEHGVQVRAFDPEAMPNVRATLGESIFYAANPYDAADGADALVLATEWNEFRSPDWYRIRKLLKSPAIFDGRNIYDGGHLRALGFSYCAIGRP